MIEIKNIKILRAAAVISAAYIMIVLVFLVGSFAMRVVAALVQGNSLILPVGSIHWAGVSILLMQGVVLFVGSALLCSIYNWFASKFGGIVVEVRDLGPRVVNE
jgi:hypothetical protein